MRFCNVIATYGIYSYLEVHYAVEMEIMHFVLENAFHPLFVAEISMRDTFFVQTIF